ncbi:CapA family protein [Phytoactinopolyspora halotolerans]|uniref:CapA family protein n=2 Tax=Phytoactinopolyspora halotolerans TaxID=1981512 RepID=A0A6L9S4K3_9ACTN|nr:CapA family protein [Phytoactinopolyspora halotolerans]
MVVGGALTLTACAGEGEPESQSTTTNPPVMSNPEPTFTQTPTPTPDPEPREFTVVATGDILLHERLWAQAERDADDDGTWNFAPQLANITPVVEEAGLAICHLEVPLAPEDGPYQGYPYFSGPPQIVPALAETGYDACTTASNHTFDQGAEGIERTLDTLDRAGMAHAGSARTKDEGRRPTVISVDTPDGPVQVGLLSYTYGFNGIPYPDGDEWRGNEIDEDTILAEAAAAREDGAEVVIAALHWGNEYVHEPNEQQLELAPRLIEAPEIDLLLGHHAHVVQPLEQIDGEWVVYGMGNLMANHAEPEGPKSEGLLTRFTFTEDLASGTFSTTAAEYLPLYQTYTPPVEVLHVPAALDSGATGTASESRLERALERTVEVVESRGGADDGLTMIGAGE